MDELSARSNQKIMEDPWYKNDVSLFEDTELASRDLSVTVTSPYLLFRGCPSRTEAVKEVIKPFRSFWPNIRMQVSSFGRPGMSPKAVFNFEFLDPKEQKRFDIFIKEIRRFYEYGWTSDRLKAVIRNIVGINP